MGKSPPGRPAAPLDDPLSYPGACAPWSFRLRGDEVTRFEGPVPRDRVPVLAVGSNACPSQLAAKFRGRPCSDELLGLVVSVDRLQVRPSAHLGRSGYWPFAPMAGAGPDCGPGRAVLCLLDDEQLHVLDRTEPNYDRRRLDGRAHAVTGAPAEVCAEGVCIYVSKHGVVDDPRLPTWSDPPPSQTVLLAALTELVPVPPELTEPAALSAALRRDPGLADDLTAAVKEHLVVRGDGLAFGS
ncbi:MAG: hypothetical protein QOC98_211 [Frankiaceae bacterium]|nr:hypothetical protein [Frankiaceae bacterium]